jgi:hypothetical protein
VVGGRRFRAAISSLSPRSSAPPQQGVHSALLSGGDRCGANRTTSSPGIGAGWPLTRTCAASAASNEMSIGNGEWKLWREGEPLSQRFTATLSDDGNTITGRWEIAEDGTNYTTDFDLIYRRVDT